MRRLLLVLPLLLAGCGGGAAAQPGSSASPLPTKVTAAQIVIKNFEYRLPGDASKPPAPVVVHVGTTITIVNEDQVDHSVTTKSGDPASYDSGLFTTGTKTFTPMTPGTYTYTCTVHAYMTGTIVVLP